MQLPISLTLLGLLTAQNHKSQPYSQESLDQYNIVRFLGTSSPYVTSTGYGISKEVPNGCNISQVALIARHGERYLTNSKGNQIIKTLQRIRNINKTVSGDLGFLPSYDFAGLDKDQFDSLTYKGSYSGVLDMFQFGLKFRNDYENLVDYDTSDVVVFASSQNRVVDTAIHFSDGFFGHGESNIVVIDEGDDTLGANSLTPGFSCLSYNSSINEDIVHKFNMNYLSTIATRLNKISPELEINEEEVRALLDYCGFDLTAVGKTEICDIFTTTELHHHSYYNDIGYYYSKGPGHNLTRYVGEAFVSGMVELFNNHQDIKISASFTHDTDLFHIFSTLGIFDNYNPHDKTQPLPVDHIDFNSNWRVSNIAPMGARLVYERLSCGVEHQTEDFVRILVNEAVIPIPLYGDGLGYTISLADFEKYIKN